MKIHHHPDQAFLVDFAAGNLPDPLSLVIEAHLTLCADCRVVVALAHAIGGALLAASAAGPVDETGRERLLNHVSIEPQASPSVISSDEDPIYPQPVQMRLKHRPPRWRAVLPGLAVAGLMSRADKGFAALLRLKPGARIPRHTHVGLEMACVLQGELGDAQRRYRRGDLAVFDEAVDHTEVAGSDECVCLIGLDAPIRLTGPIGRIASLLLPR